MEPHSGLNNLDLIVIGIILLSGLLALVRGFTREIFSLLAWAGAYFAAVHYYPFAVPYMHHHIKNDKAAEWAAIAAVFVVALIALMIVGGLVASLIRGKALTAIDRSLGFVYGLVRGVLVVSLLYLGAMMFLWSSADKPAQTETASTAIDGQPQDNAKSDKDKDKDRNPPPPDMLLTAKTRPMMAYGASKLMAFVPQDIIDKTLQNIETHKDETDKAEAQKTLDRLSTPVPPQPGPPDIDRPEGR